MSTNIKGLDSLVGAIDAKLNHVDAKHQSLDIQGGAGILVTRMGNQYVIGLQDNNNNSIIDTKPWDIVINRREGTDDTYYASTLGGTINGYLPDNWDDIADINDDDEPQYVILQCQTSYYGIEQAEIILDSIQPDTNRIYSVNSLPTEFELLIAIIAQKKITNQFYRGHLQSMPTLAYSFENLDRESDLDHYYTWSLSENT